MAKVEVPFDQYMREATAALTHQGVLLVSLDPQGKPNAMAIGWGAVGNIWGKPMYICLVRPSRYTYRCLEATGDFTVNLLYPQYSQQVLFCGTKSGRDCDKFAECGFTAVPAETVKSPYIAQSGLVYECRVVHYNDVIPDHFAQEILDSAYTEGDFHRVYFGEILRTLAEEDFADRA